MAAVKLAAPAHPCARRIRASMHVIASIEEPVLIERILAPHAARRRRERRRAHKARGRAVRESGAGRLAKTDLQVAVLCRGGERRDIGAPS